MVTPLISVCTLSLCGIGLVWDDLLQTCVPSEEFVEALQINACGEVLVE